MPTNYTYSIEQMKQIKSDAKKDFSKLKANFKIVDSYYQQIMDLGNITKAALQYKPPTAHNFIDVATDHIMGYGQKVQMYAWNGREDTKKSISLLENFGRSVLRVIEKRYRTNIRRNVVKNLFKLGIGVMKAPLYVLREKPDELTDEEWLAEMGYGFPFVFQSIHPANITFDEAANPEFVIEEYQRTIGSIKAIYPDYKTALPDSQRVDYWEFWATRQRQYFVNDEAILDDAEDKLTGLPHTENGSGFVPYEIGNAGFGSDSPEGKPEETYVSLLAPILSALKHEARLKTARIFGMQQDIYGKLILDKFPNYGVDFDLPDRLGDIGVIDPKYNARYLNPPQVSQDSYKILADIVADESVIVPPTTYGQYPKGMTSGYMGAISVGQARIKFQGVASAWECMAGATLDKMLALIQKIEEPVGLFGDVLTEGSKDVITVEPKMINPRVQHYVITLEPESPEEKTNRTKLGIELQQNNGLPLPIIQRDYYGYDPVEMQDVKLLQDLTNDPQIHQLLVQRAMTNSGLTSQLDMIDKSTPPEEQRQNPQEEQFTGRNYIPDQMKLNQGGAGNELGSQEEMGGAPYEQQ